MAKLNIKQLESKSREELLDIIIEVSNFNTQVSDFININYLMTVDKKVKALTSIYKRYLRSTRYYDYHETITFCDGLTNEVIKPLELLVPQAPIEVANLIQLMIDNFENILNDKDDSSGCGMDLLYTLVEVWGKAWQYVPNKDYNELAKIVANYAENHGYISEFIFDDFKFALGKIGFEELERCLTNERYIFYVVGLQNNPDKYMLVIKDRNNYKPEYILHLAQMLIEELRSNEAIEWIEKYVALDLKVNLFYGSDNLYIKRQELLIKAYLDEGMSDKAQEERWNTFLKTCGSKYYLQFIQHTDEVQREEYKQKAINLIQNNNTFIGSVWGFLADIQEFTELSNSILYNLDKIREVNVSGLRNVTKELAAHGQYLAAVLVRRSLVENVLSEAKSKYYDYAVSDLKLAMEYGSLVVDWDIYENNEVYIDRLRNTHGKKYSFWNRISFL